jgi:non-heme chloroperoxidase
MKIVVIGGSGLIGSKLVERLREAGHEPLAASPDSGIDTLTGEGLADALEAAEVVVDVSNAPGWSDAAVLEFFQTSTRNILAAEATLGVSHHLALSVVGTDRLLDSGYFRAKLAQEEAIKAATIPYTIVRATQFFEFVGRIADSNSDGETVRVPPVLVQPEAADDVAAALAVAAVGAPVNGTVELAGPERFRLDELARRVLGANGDPRVVTADGRARYFGAELDDRSLIPGDDARIAPTRFEDWLSQTMVKQTKPQAEDRRGGRRATEEDEMSTSVSATPITEHELEQIERANATTATPVVFIHGLWLLPSSWEPWAALFEEAGYVALMPGWPDDPATVAAARANPELLANKTLKQVADHTIEVLTALDNQPAVIGHSTGGLLAQMLAGRGLSAVTVAIDPGVFRGVLPLPASVLRGVGRLLVNPRTRRRAITFTFDQFRYGWANALDETEARELYDRFHVAGSGISLVQMGNANLNPWTEAKVDTKHPDRGPLLIIEGEQDHTVPWAIAHAAYKRQRRNPGVTEIVKLPNRGHALTIDHGWREVAETALTFVKRFT